MQNKLKLDPDELRVDTFVAHDAAPERGTVHANDEAATLGATCRTQCYTLGCCPNTALC
jgi:hypothetical protein